MCAGRHRRNHELQPCNRLGTVTVLQGEVINLQVQLSDTRNILIGRDVANGEIQPVNDGVDVNIYRVLRGGSVRRKTACRVHAGDCAREITAKNGCDVAVIIRRRFKAQTTSPCRHARLQCDGNGRPGKCRRTDISASLLKSGKTSDIGRIHPADWNHIKCHGGQRLGSVLIRGCRFDFQHKTGVFIHHKGITRGDHCIWHGLHRKIQRRLGNRSDIQFEAFTHAGWTTFIGDSGDSVVDRAREMLGQLFHTELGQLRGVPGPCGRRSAQNSAVS